MGRRIGGAIAALAAAGLFGCAGGDGFETVTHQTAGPDGYDVNALTNGGTGPWRVVVITGAPSRLGIWKAFLSAAPAHLETFVVERAGYNRKGPRAPVLDFDEQVAAVAPLLSDPDRPCVALVGISYGGQLALKAAIDRPETVDALVLGAPLVTEPRWLQRRMVNVGGWWGVRLFLPYWLRNPRDEVVARRAQIEEVLDAADTVRAPTVIVHGDADPVVPLSDSKLLETKFAPEAEVEFHLAEGKGHYFFRSSPHILIGAIERAIDRAEAEGACPMETNNPDERA